MLYNRKKIATSITGVEFPEVEKNFNDSPRYGTLTRNPFIKVSTMCVAALAIEIVYFLYIRIFIIIFLVLLVFLKMFNKLAKEPRLM